MEYYVIGMLLFALYELYNFNYYKKLVMDKTDISSLYSEEEIEIVVFICIIITTIFWPLPLSTRFVKLFFSFFLK
jgi:hypothetical protein